MGVVHKQGLPLPFNRWNFRGEGPLGILAVGPFQLGRKGHFRIGPLHHHFELQGWKESKIIARFWIAALIFALFALTTLKLR